MLFIQLHDKNDRYLSKLYTFFIKWGVNAEIVKNIYLQAVTF